MFDLAAKATGFDLARSSWFKAAFSVSLLIASRSSSRDKSDDGWLYESADCLAGIIKLPQGKPPPTSRH